MPGKIKRNARYGLIYRRAGGPITIGGKHYSQRSMRRDSLIHAKGRSSPGYTHAGDGKRKRGRSGFL